MHLLDQWTDSTLMIGSESAIFSDVWGFEVQDSQYVVLGSTEGAHFFQIKNNRLYLKDFIPGAFQNAIVRHRDYKFYRNHIYAVCDEGPSSLQIIDVSTLPDSVSLVYDNSAYFQTAHNIAIDTLKAKLYVCGPNSVGMKVFDISIPDSPVLINDFTDVAYVHDAFVSADTAFLNCGFDGLRVYDFGGSVPILKGILDFYPDQGYNHSGWMNDSRTKYVFTDESEGTKLKLCELGDLSKISVKERFGNSDYKELVPHNVIVLEDLAVVAYYNAGLRIYDISRYPIKEIGAYDTYPDESNYKLNGAWGVYLFKDQNQILISDQQYGLFLFEFPIQIWEQGPNNGTFITSTYPFIDKNGILISRDYFDEDGLFFTVTDATGAVVYNHESYTNWFGIPLGLSPGTYIYGIFNSDRQRLEGGKFILSH